MLKIGELVNDNGFVSDMSFSTLPLELRLYCIDDSAAMRRLLTHVLARSLSPLRPPVPDPLFLPPLSPPSGPASLSGTQTTHVMAFGDNATHVEMFEEAAMKDRYILIMDQNLEHGGQSNILGLIS